MYVIVVGAGEVGSYVAERLSREGHDIAVIERDAKKCAHISEHLDVLTVQGSGTHPSKMQEAGVAKADLVVAVTSIDEVNLLAARIAKIEGVERTVVRIEASELRSRSAEALCQDLGADLVIDPDEATAQEILELLEYPGAAEVAVMGGGEVIVLGARLPEDAPIVGKTLLQIGQEYEPHWDFLFGAISRGDETIIPRGDHVVQAHDLLRVVCRRDAQAELLTLLGLNRGVPRRIMLLGGGRTAKLLAARLDARGGEVALVEQDPVRARELAEKLPGVLVLEGDMTDSDLLAEEGIGDYDAVIALTGADDANVLACLYARSVGAKETIAVVHGLALLPLLAESGIDAALSPRTATANAVLRFVRGGVAQVATFLEGEAEVLELEVFAGSPADGAVLAELRLPKDVLIGAIVRDGKAHIGRGRSELRSRDHVVVFAMPHVVEDVKQVFG